MYTYLYFGWLFIFNNDNIFFYIKTQSIWLLNSVFKFKSLHHKTQSSNKEIPETNCSLCNNFDWFTRNGTLWDEYFIQKKTYCVFLRTRRNLPLKSPTPILIDLHGMTHHGMTILYIQIYCVLLKFPKIPQHQFWLIYTEYHMKQIYYTVRDTVFKLKFRELFYWKL